MTDDSHQYVFHRFYEETASGLLHVTSFPSFYGIGDVDPNGYQVDLNQ